MWPVRGHTCPAVHSRTSVESLGDMIWKILLCLARDLPLLAHRGFRFPVKFIQLCHHAVNGCLRNCLTGQTTAGSGVSHQARPLGKNSELEKFQKRFIFCMCNKKTFYLLSSSVIIPLLSNPVLKFPLTNHFFAASFQECSNYSA